LALSFHHLFKRFCSCHSSNIFSTSSYYFSPSTPSSSRLKALLNHGCKYCLFNLLSNTPRSPPHKVNEQ
jgi:hypothetical protein